MGRDRWRWRSCRDSVRGVSDYGILNYLRYLFVLMRREIRFV